MDGSHPATKKATANRGDFGVVVSWLLLLLLLLLLFSLIVPDDDDDVAKAGFAGGNDVGLLISSGYPVLSRLVRSGITVRDCKMEFVTNNSNTAASTKDKVRRADNVVNDTHAHARKMRANAKTNPISNGSVYLAHDPIVLSWKNRVRSVRVLS